MTRYRPFMFRDTRSCTAAAAIAAALLAVFSPFLAAGPVPAPLDLDPAFAGDGTVIADIGQVDYGFAGLIEADGDVVVFGYSETGGPSNGEAIFHRIEADGTPGTLARFDASAFGCSVPRSFRAGIRLSNGDYLGGGYVQEGCSGLPRYFNVIQVTSSGMLVGEYDRIPFADQLAYVSAMAEQSDGSVVAVGFASTSGFDAASYDIAAARFTPFGDLDPTFGTGGMFTLNVDGDQDSANDVVIDDQDRILIAGRSRSAGGDSHAIALRLTPDGALDASFDGDGLAMLDDGGLGSGATSIDIVPNARILVGGGRARPGGAQDPVIWALDGFGSPDPLFGDGGIATLDFSHSYSAVSDIRYAAWRIYAIGSGRPIGGAFADNDAAVSVLRLNGTPNPLFNGGASRVFQFDASAGTRGDFPQSIDVTDDGEQIAIIGFSSDNDQAAPRIAVARVVGLENALFIDGFEGGTR